MSKKMKLLPEKWLKTKGGGNLAPPPPTRFQLVFPIADLEGHGDSDAVLRSQAPGAQDRAEQDREQWPGKGRGWGNSESPAQKVT